MEIGEFVRTKNGLIGVVNKIEEKGNGLRLAGEFLSDEIIQFNDGKFYERRVRKQDITKHSKNLIDLIEEDDILEVYMPIRKVFMKICVDKYFKDSFVYKAIIDKKYLSKKY